MVNSRLRKLAGMILFVPATIAYFLLVIAVAVARLPGTPMAAQLAYYAVSTAIWFVFAAKLVQWMQKAPEPVSRR
jgi:hypothetical protein